MTVRRFAPRGGAEFCSGARWAEFRDGVFAGFVWRDVPAPRAEGFHWTLAEAVRLVRRGTWEELPPPRPQRRSRGNVTFRGL